jgi:hypothetical protein
MERLTSPNINVDPGTDRFLHAAIGGKEIDWKQSRDSTLNVLINGPTSNGFGKDIFRKMARDLYGRLKAYEDIAELFGGIDRLREIAEADKDGRVIVLPAKKGDTLYAVTRFGVEKRVVKEIAAPFFYNTYESSDRAALPTAIRNFGKTVFLTREEAEKALQEMEGKKDG